MKYIDPEKLIAEIKRLIDSYKSAKQFGDANMLRNLLSFIESLEKEQPQGLDEAAEESMPEEDGFLEIDIYGGSKAVYSREQMLAMFKAGAELMAGQGVNADFEVCKLANRAWLTPIDEKRFMQDVFDNFTAGDEVVVQIRKKDTK